MEEPLVGVVSEFEDRKHKVRVLQVERGVPDEVSYRCEDLKSGKVVVRFNAPCIARRLTGWLDRYSELGSRADDCILYIARGYA